MKMADDERLVVRLQLGSTWPLATRTPGRARPQCLYDQPFCVDVVIAVGVILRAVVASRSVVQAGSFCYSTVAAEAMAVMYAPGIAEHGRSGNKRTGN